MRLSAASRSSVSDKVKVINMDKVKIIRILSVFFFLSGIIFSTWSAISLNQYFKTNSGNRLPPAGSFIDGSDKFTFAVMADSGLRDEPINAVIKDMKSKKVKFIIHLGDQARRLSANHFEHLLQSLDSQLGDTPFYAVPGNHDATHGKKSTLRYYKRAFGQPNYWFSYGNTLFVAINTAFGNFDKEQQAWLKNVLKNLRPMFTNCILLTHMPPEDPRPGKSYAMYGDIDELKSIISKFKINAIIAGHIHEYNASQLDGIPLYTAPPSGQKMRGATTMFGYLLCAIDKSSKLNVKKVDITDKKGRDYLQYFLSTELDGITTSIISFSLLSAAFMLLFLSSGTRRR